MEKLQVFKNEEFGEVRSIMIDGTPWFAGKDISVILGYSNPQKAIRDHVDDEDRTVNESFTVNGTMATLVNESGLYSLIMASKLPSARRFKHWVTSEVLPSIRKSGGYIAGQEDMTEAELLAKALTVARNIIDRKQALIDEARKDIDRMRPKEIFADAVSASRTSILIGDLAKLLKQNGYETGQKRLFEWMRRNGYLIKAGASKNMPTQRAMDLRLFEVKEGTVVNPDGSIRTTKTTKVTGKGQVYFTNMLLSGAET